MKNILKNTWVQVVLGSTIYAIATNIFISPLCLFNGGIVGIAQVLRTILADSFGIGVDFDLASIINFLLNVPIFIIAYKSMNPKFFYASLVSVIAISVVMAVCPIPTASIINDTFASAIVGGAICGYGISMVLNVGASAGGLDVLGLYATLHFNNFSVGKFSLIVNSFLFLICAFYFDIPTAIYSIINTYVFTTVLDKKHVRNLESTLMIFTSNPEIKNVILKEFVRGVTYWNGKGAYTGNEKEVLVTVCAQDEINKIEEGVRKLDENAFFIVIPDLKVTGGFEKRLIIE